MISVIIVQHNHPDLTRGAVDSLRKYNAGENDIVVVDNGSSDPAVRALTEHFTGCRVIFNRINAGFGAANNIGARVSRGSILLFLNNDTLVHEEILPQIESYFARTPSCGAAGLQLLNPDGTAQISTGRFPTVWTEWRMRRQIDPYRGAETILRDWVSGAALAVRRSVFDEAGGFDERYFMYLEDVDLCARIHAAGHEIHYLPAVRVEHMGGGSQPGGIPARIQKEYRRSQLLYYSRHASTSDNVLLRAYLFAKFLPGRVRGDSDQRDVAAYVHSILLRPAGEYRD